MPYCSSESASNVVSVSLKASQLQIINNLQESSKQEQLLGRKRKVELGAQPVERDRPPQNGIAAAGQSQPKRMRLTEEDRLSVGLPHAPATATNFAEGKQDTQHAKQAAAAATLTATPESGQLASPDHDAEMLLAEVESHQTCLNEPPVQKAYTNRRDLLAAVFDAKTSADRMAKQEPPEPPLAQKLNPNNVAYDPVCAAEHRAKRAEDPHYLDSKMRKQQSKLLKRVHWVQKSAFTAEEHGYLLDLEGECHVSSALRCDVLCCVLLCCAVMGWAGLFQAALSQAVLHCAVLVCAPGS